MKSFEKAAVLAAVTTLAGATLAQASTYTFNFVNAFPNDSESVYVRDTEDKIGVTITGQYYSKSGDTFVAGDAHDVDSNDWGLISQNGEQHTLDSYGSLESFKFTFDDGMEYSLEDVDVSWSYQWEFENGKRVKTRYDGGADYAYYDLFADGSYVSTIDGAFVATDDVANMWAIGMAMQSGVTEATCQRPVRAKEAKAHGMTRREWLKNNRSINFACYRSWAKYSGIKIESITVLKEDPAPVPLPAAGWLLLGGIGGMAALRRAKKKS